MKNLLTKLVIAAFAFCAFNVAQASTLITNITANGTYRLLSSGAGVSKMQFYSASAARISFYDETTMTDPYYGTNKVIGSYVSSSSTVTTNVLGPIIGGSGYTNYITNIVLSTSYTTNAAATNEATKIYQVNIPPATYLNVDMDMVLTKGLVVHGLATNLSVTINYNAP